MICDIGKSTREPKGEGVDIRRIQNLYALNVSWNINNAMNKTLCYDVEF